MQFFTDPIGFWFKMYGLWWSPMLKMTLWQLDTYDNAKTRQSTAYRVKQIRKERFDEGGFTLLYFPTIRHDE